MSSSPERCALILSSPDHPVPPWVVDLIGREVKGIPVEAVTSLAEAEFSLRVPLGPPLFRPRSTTEWREIHHLWFRGVPCRRPDLASDDEVYESSEVAALATLIGDSATGTVISAPVMPAMRPTVFGDDICLMALGASRPFDGAVWDCELVYFLGDMRLYHSAEVAPAGLDVLYEIGERVVREFELDELTLAARIDDSGAHIVDVRQSVSPSNDDTWQWVAELVAEQWDQPPPS